MYFSTRVRRRAPSRGSSKGISSGYATPQKGEKGYEPMLFSKDFDLMKYYSEYVPPDLYRTVESDLKSLIWLSLIKLGELK
ncbi:hypothetical protein DOL88_02365 [Aggregatibacter aphrophilus]|uniref:Uncharacterized protein n=1 Tax=Aggregatibacter aphrophilus TaxID=732 RepID=A0ABX9VWV3_AGGAP|nr:hypothetical protein DOL88_02365 [Aggregatibacter aphrophilus]